MKVVAIVQARMGSTRLPGKVMAQIGGRPMLARVCGRVSRAALVDQVVVATSHQARDDVLADYCDRLGVACFRGDESDVLDRYHRAARAYRADAVVRITADCPLIDPQVIDRVVAAFLEERPDYAANTLVRTWPRGLDTEVMTADALAEAARRATEDYQRTHVTPYLYDHPELFRLLPVFCRTDLGAARWTVDESADLDFVRVVYRRLGPGERFSWDDVRRLLDREPALSDINREIRQKHVHEG